MKMQAISTLSLASSRPSVPVADSAQPEVLLGESDAVRRLRTQISRVAPYLRTALLVGQSGSGKQQIARALHAGGPQAAGPFIACSASAFAEALFGDNPEDESGSILNAARGGTLYLSGIEELAYPLQGALQRFLARREAGRTLSGSSTMDVKIIAGACRNLNMISSTGQFRSDLYAKLSALEIRIPALHDRTEDLGALAASMLLRAPGATGSAGKVLSPAALDKLTSREWSGNLRELEQAIFRAAQAAEGHTVEAEHLPGLAETATRRPAHIPVQPEEAAADERLHHVVQRHVLNVLTRQRGNKLRAAEVLGISRSTLYRMLEAGSFMPEMEKRGH